MTTSFSWGGKRRRTLLSVLVLVFLGVDVDLRVAVVAVSVVIIIGVVAVAAAFLWNDNGYLSLSVGFVVEDHVAACAPDVRAYRCQCHVGRYQLWLVYRSVADRDVGMR